MGLSKKPKTLNPKCQTKLSLRRLARRLSVRGKEVRPLMRQSRPAGRGLFVVVWVRVVTSRFVIGSGAQAAVLG